MNTNCVDLGEGVDDAAVSAETDSDTDNRCEMFGDSDIGSKEDGGKSNISVPIWTIGNEISRDSAVCASFSSVETTFSIFSNISLVVL